MPHELVPAETRRFPRLPFREILFAFQTMYANKPAILTEYVVSGHIEKDDLRASLALPFEIGMTEYEGEVVVTPLVRRINGVTDPNNRHYDYTMRNLDSRLSAHTHPGRQQIVVDTLSLGDLAHFISVSDETSIIVVDQNGISQFQKPLLGLDGIPLNPNQTPATSDQYDELLGKFQEEKGFSIIALSMGFSQMDVATQTELAREFVRRTGMLVREASWDSKNIDELLSVVNLHS